ncbi:hypothetical protein T08_9205, partial [Trichinella sp. T8]
LGTMCSGDAQQLFDGRIMPCRNRSLKCSLATCSSCGGNRRGLQWTGCPVVSIAKRAAVQCSCGGAAFQIFETDYRFSYIISFLEVDTESR